MNDIIKDRSADCKPRKVLNSAVKLVIRRFNVQPRVHLSKKLRIRSRFRNFNGGIKLNIGKLVYLSTEFHIIPRKQMSNLKMKTISYYVKHLKTKKKLFSYFKRCHQILHIAISLLADSCYSSEKIF